MKKSLRLSERWFNRGLWLLALIFAAFLVGLGSAVVEDLPTVEHPVQREDYLDQDAAKPLRATIESTRKSQQDVAAALEQAELKLRAAEQAYASERDTFSNWIATRKATKLPEQDDELIARTQSLDALKGAENQARQAVEAQRQAGLDAQQLEAGAQHRLDDLEFAADKKVEAASRRAELHAFLVRLALTLPLLVVAGWLFVRKRKSPWWPFVWGFIFFALFAFFVELVPYMPSYGGYVHSAVGVLVTLLVGRYLIVLINRRIAEQKLAEAQPDAVRRDTISYDDALLRMAKNACPSCERPVNLAEPTLDFCPHCGIGLFNRCPTCATRKNAFAPFCQSCGTQARVAEAA